MNVQAPQSHVPIGTIFRAELGAHSAYVAMDV